MSEKKCKLYCFRLFVFSLLCNGLLFAEHSTGRDLLNSTHPGQIIDRIQQLRTQRPPSEAGFRSKCIYRAVADRRHFLVDMVDKIKAKTLALNCGAKSPKLLASGGLSDPIPFHSLPSNYLLKANHGSGMNCFIRSEQVLCNWQASRPIPTLASFEGRQTLEAEVKRWLQFTYSFLEWPYTRVDPRWLVEELLPTTARVNEYKLFMFGRKLGATRAIKSRTTGRRDGNIAFLDTNWTIRSDAGPQDESHLSKFEIPKTFDEMQEVARCLVGHLDHARVDFFELDTIDENGSVKRDILFGEITLSSMACQSFLPPSLECELGAMWNIPDHYDVTPHRTNLEDLHTLFLLQKQEFSVDEPRLFTQWSGYLDHDACLNHSHIT